METPILILVLIVGLVVMVWLLSKPYAVFVVRIKQGRPSAERGKVTEAFLCAVEDVCRDQGIEAGEIRACRRGGSSASGSRRDCRGDSASGSANWWAISGLGGAAESGVRWSWSSRRFHDAERPTINNRSVNDLTVFPPVRAAAPLSGWKTRPKHYFRGWSAKNFQILSLMPESRPRSD